MQSVPAIALTAAHLGGAAARAVRLHIADIWLSEAPPGDLSTTTS